MRIPMIPHGVADTVAKVGQAKMAVGMERTIAALPRRWIEHEPRPEIESIGRGDQMHFTAAWIADVPSPGIAGVRVNGHLKPVNGLLKIPCDTYVHMVIEIGLFEEGQDPTVHSPGAVVSCRRHVEIDESACR